MCAAVRCRSSLDPALMVQHVKQLENILWILLCSVCWSASQHGKILAEYKLFVTVMITKYKAPFHFGYSVSCRVGWLNCEKAEAFEIMHAVLCHLQYLYHHHTVMSCDIIKNLFGIFSLIHLQVLSPLVKEDLSTISPVRINLFNKSEAIIIHVWERSFLSRDCSTYAKMLYPLPTVPQHRCICLLNIVFWHRTNYMHQNNPEFIMHILLMKAKAQLLINMAAECCLWIMRVL